MTSATDNRTTELLDGLRNVGNLDEFAELFGFNWSVDSDWTWHDVAVKMADELEQAIAATLGCKREAELHSALNEVSKKWAQARIEAEDYAKENLLLKAKLDSVKLWRGTCRIEHRGMGYYCSGCGTMVGSDDPESELYIYANAIELWCFCPRCGSVVSVDD